MAGAASRGAAWPAILTPTALPGKLHGSVNKYARKQLECHGKKVTIKWIKIELTITKAVK